MREATASKGRPSPSRSPITMTPACAFASARGPARDARRRQRSPTTTSLPPWAAETYTAHCSASSADRFSKVCPTPCTAAPSSAVAAASDERCSLGIYHPARIFERLNIMTQVQPSFTQRLLLAIATGFALVSSNVALAQTSVAMAKPLRVIVISELPEVITYYDQGFSDFIRDSKSVPLQGTTFSSIFSDAIFRELKHLGFDATSAAASPEFVRARSDLVARVKGKAFAPSISTEMEPLLIQLRKDNTADAVVIVSPGRISSERFVEGPSVLTKIGLLGIEHFSIVFTMMRLETYSVERSISCPSLAAFDQERIPAIYSNWKTDMTDGPTPQVAAAMQATIVHAIAPRLAESISKSAQSLSACLEPIQR